MSTLSKTMLLESIEKNIRFHDNSKRYSLNVVQEEQNDTTTNKNFENLIDGNFEIIGKMIWEKEAWNECNISLRTIACKNVSEVEAEFWDNRSCE